MRGRDAAALSLGWSYDWVGGADGAARLVGLENATTVQQDLKGQMYIVQSIR
jgi:hypothetical protein